MQAAHCLTRRALVFLIALALLFEPLFLSDALFEPVLPRAAYADNTYQTLTFSQDWSDTSLITEDHNWSGVSGIIGYRGNDLITTTGVDPQTILVDGSTSPNVRANRSNPNTDTFGGVAEFELANPTVAFQGHGSADAPHLVLHLNTTGRSTITVSYNLRDVDGSTRNAITPVALQYRVGETGDYTNVPAGFVADATGGPSEATLVTPVSAVLPADANNQPMVQVRIITAVAAGGNEWVGIDDIQVEAVTAVRLNSFTAVEDGGGVLLSWQTGYEVDNLGFNIYREVDGRRARINPAIVAGSALLAGPGGVLTAGGAYAWRDRSPGKKGNVAYWLEDIDLNGASAWHGPVTPQKASVKAIKRTPSATLDALNAAVTAHPATVIERVQPAPVGYKEHSASGLAVSSADAEPSDKQLKKQWELAARPAIKLSVREPGWYRVGQPELLAAGLPPDVDPHYFQLYADGRQQRILVTGERDRHFGPDDAIEFYGVGLDTPATDARTYWLIVGPQPGKRIKTARGAGARPATARNFPMTVERRERINYFPAAQNGDAENFFGRIVAQTPITQVLNLPNLDLAATEEASLEVALQGVTDQPGVDHRVRISLNGTEVGEMIFDGRSHRAARIPIPHRLLRAGENTISLAAVNSERDISLLDAIRITYRHTYNADDDALRFTATGGEAVRVGGFTEPDIRVIDITNPLAVTKARATVEPQGAGYAVKVNAPGAGTRTLMAFTNRQAKRAAAVAANRPSEWHRGARGADMVVIGHGDFLDAVQPLVAHRQSQGFAVVAADVEDLYDEFSYGARSPFAVKEFLRRSAAGKRPPRYVLFVGDASLDPRNYMGHGDFDFVPTKLMETSAMETASDDWFADFDGDELAEMAVGRLPARDAAEAARMAAKVVAYDQTEASGGVLLVADSQEGAAFEEANRQLRAAVPPPVSVREIFPSRTGVAAAKAEMIESINRGQMIVNYTGHSSVSFLRGNLLTVQDAPALANSGRLSLFVLMTCLSSYFHNPVGESLAEALMQAEGGAVAVWASSGFTEPSGQARLNLELYRELFRADRPTLGEAATRAKIVVGSRDIRRTWILFGDPTTRLR